MGEKLKLLPKEKKKVMRILISVGDLSIRDISAETG